MQESPLIPQLASTWLFWLLVGGTLCIGLLRYQYAHRFTRLLRLPFRNYNFDSSELRMDLFNGSLEFWSIAAMALAITLVSKSELQFSDWTLTVRYALIIGVFLTFQGLLYQLAGYIFQDQEAYSSAWHEKSMFLRWAAIWITPLLWWLSFGIGPRELLAIAGGIFLILLYLWALGRTALVLLRKSSLRPYHNLLYLCALEISPVLIFIFLVS
ncbi:DUF4271 domain-containing protein [Phaeocystidibacter marisrubri]|nr:DUF4271 domain-containing protein [Phaeocystidibacter marisrubri]